MFTEDPDFGEAQIAFEASTFFFPCASDLVAIIQRESAYYDHCAGSHLRHGAEASSQHVDLASYLRRSSKPEHENLRQLEKILPSFPSGDIRRSTE